MKKADSRRILVAGAMGRRGRKVLEFLKSRNYHVASADKLAEENIEGVPFFKMNLKHRDSLWLTFSVFKPNTLIYCAVSKNTIENYDTFLNVLLTALKFGVKEVVVVVDKIYGEKEVGSPYDIDQLAIALLVKVLARQYKLRYTLIDQSQNLLKEVKLFLKDHE